ncbi:MAG: MFS transporter [Rhodobacteraceae bacterium]|nr:MFS transporter [Paracoccaceae bacterium]
MFVITFFPLFLSVILLQLSSGGIGPLDALSGAELGFTTQQIGLLGSSHFIGFFIGCWYSPRLIGIIGHSRAFAVFAAAGTIGILAHMIYTNPYAWSVMRILSGMCIAGCFTVIEAWLQAKTTNATRGRNIGMYRLFDMVGGIFGQLLIAVLSPASYISYNILAIICCASLLPLALTRIKQPDTAVGLKLKPMLAFRISPMATTGVVAAGLTTASFRMIGPVYGQEIGLAANQIGFFLAIFLLGGALAQYPAGWLADRFDRRKVMLIFSAIAVLACGATVAASTSTPAAVFAASMFFGFATFPIYSIAAAHANDFVDAEHMAELSSSLIFFYAVGAIVSPYLASTVITLFGPPAMFALIAAVHVALAATGLFRMTIRPAKSQTAFTTIPRTTFVIGRLFKHRSIKK